MPSNAGFETPDQGSGGGAYTYTPSNSSWNFGGAAGIAANNSGFNVTGAGTNNPDGTRSTSGQAAFIQGSGGGAYFSQNITISASTYATFYFSIEQRGTGNQSIQVLLDSTDLGTYTTSSASALVAKSTAPIAVTGGTHTLKFQGLTSADVTAFMDDVFFVTGGQTVNQASTSTTLTTSSNSITYGGNVTYTASVTSGATGTVTFKDGSTSLGTGTLSNGSATYTIKTPLTGGTHSITAVYGGDTNYATSTSSAVTQTVTKATPTTTVTSSGTQLTGTTTYTNTYNSSVTFTATVPSSATGTVAFKDGSTTLGTGTISNGTATYAISSLSITDHAITAVYGGDTNYNSNTSSTITQRVNKYATTTSVVSSSSSSVSGNSVTFTATVTSGATGTVTIYDGATSLGSGTISGTTASISSSSLSVGPHTITAVYNGDSYNATSTSSSITQNVYYSTTSSVTSSASAIYTGGNVTFTATLGHTASGPTAGGSFTFKDGATTLGTVTLDSATGTTATYTTTALTTGLHTITVVYGGDINYYTSTSAGVAQTVTQKYKVNALTDSNTGSGSSGDLRWAVTQANAGNGYTEIQFVSGGNSGSINLASALPTLIKNVTITGPGASNLSIKGSGSASNFRALAISSGVTVSISDLTFKNFSLIGAGSAGGAITNSGNLTLNNDTFNNNTITTTSGEIDGGAIYSDGTLTVNTSQFTNNTSAASAGWGDGAAISMPTSGTASASTSIANSTFSGNSISSSQYAIGIIFVRAGQTLNITGSTFSNTSGDAIYESFSPTAVTVSASTFSGNTGAGIVSSPGGPLTVTS